MKSGLYRFSVEVAEGMRMAALFAYDEKTDTYHGLTFDTDTDQDGMRMALKHPSVKLECLSNEDFVVGSIGDDEE